MYPDIEFLGHMVILYLVFLRKLPTVFHHGHTNYLLPPTVQRVPFSPHPCQNSVQTTVLVLREVIFIALAFMCQVVLGENTRKLGD